MTVKDSLVDFLPSTTSAPLLYSGYRSGKTACQVNTAATRKTGEKTSNTRSLLSRKAPIIFALVIVSTQLTGCNTLNNRPDDTIHSCATLEGHSLDAHLKTTRHALSNGCEHRFDDYFAQLLRIAEGDPGNDNKRHFSEFLVWSTAEGIVSKRQATTLYNRYFNAKFVSLMGDYNNCSHTCPNRHTVIAEMEQELADKERGLLKISADSAAYYQAVHLFKETELVLEATCTACIARR